MLQHSRENVRWAAVLVLVALMIGLIHRDV
jgi:hypothetical protein